MKKIILCVLIIVFLSPRVMAEELGEAISVMVYVSVIDMLSVDDSCSQDPPPPECNIVDTQPDARTAQEQISDWRAIPQTE